ncbi:MAG: hypothetical protein NTX65_07125 [Ignavibacteriales bacterium]|nr:hypothetical protein [Ignavibacteriales bacterium]
MKQVVCLYCEGTDAKLAVLSKDNNGVKVHRVSSLTVSRSILSSSKKEVMVELENKVMDTDLSFDNLDSVSTVDSQSHESSDVEMLDAALHDLKLRNMLFIPIVTEPIVNYHSYDGPRNQNKKKLIQSVISDLQVTKGITVTEDLVDITEMNEKSMLGVFLEGDMPCVDLIGQLANFNKRRYLKIPTIKTAELSLTYYVSKSTKFFPEDNSLIVYIGKEYSKLIFLEGQKLKHIGSPLDIGTKNLHTYDVYFSKILLEMENGGISKLDNIILCGEDRSENLILSFYGTFPEANVSELKFENFDSTELNEEDQKNLALFAIPISAGIEYFDELDKTHVGVNFLPKYIQENQKFLQFGWHSYALMPFLFGAAFFFTFKTLSNFRDIKELDFEINRLNQRQIQNQALVQEITPLETRINSFDATQKIIDDASEGAGLWNSSLGKISDFAETRRNFWVSKIEPVSRDEIKLTGYSLSRSVLTEFAGINKSSLLKNINFEPLREKSAFSYTINLRLQNDSTKTQ